MEESFSKSLDQQFENMFVEFSNGEEVAKKNRKRAYFDRKREVIKICINN
ncbi:unnamed protein product [Arabidopsis halleri]